jgi:ABC-type uncharacterized transport system substrate-binding protein
MNVSGKVRALAAAAAALLAAGAQAQSVAGTKVLFVNSYHAGYEWSDGEEQGASAALKGTGVELRFARMDAKLKNVDDASRKAAAEKIRAEIEAWKPDAVIVADDVAVKYLLQAHYKDAKLPFVFCGVNWDASKYGLPYKNATGMLEVSFAHALMESLKPYAKGSRIAYLTVDSETERIEAAAYKKEAGIEFVSEKFVKTMAEWKAAYAELQGKVDVVFVGNKAGAPDWNDADAAAFVAKSTKVVSGSIYDFMAPYAMVNFSKVAEEHGAWAAKVATDIIKGASPASIAISRNKQSRMVVNPKLAAGAGIVFAPDLMRTAVVMR